MLSTRPETESPASAPRTRRRKTLKWLDALDQNGHACDRDDTFNLQLHKGTLVTRADREWGITLRKSDAVYRTTQYTTRENALKGARRLYTGLMRQQPTGENGHEVDAATGETITPCGCIACAGAEINEKGAAAGDAEQKNPREAVQRWAPVWSAAGLKARGWTEAMIREYLGKADALAKNPHYRSASPMRLYYQERVQEAEKSDGFTSRKALAAGRSKAGKAAAATRAANLEEWAENVEIGWIGPPEDAGEAIRLGIKSWEDWNGCKANELDPATRIRWARNYIRHECMSYEELVYTGGMQRMRKTYRTIRDRCDEMIDDRYPDLMYSNAD